MTSDTLPWMECPYGSWRSPITAERVAAGSAGFSDPTIADGYVWWIEARPLEGGRQVVIRARPDGSERADAFGPDWSARTRVHEYGGGSYAVVDRELVFSNDADGRVYRGTTPLTPEPSRPRALRYADFEVAGERILCVRESHEGAGEPVNDIVTLDGELIASGADFYAAPRVAADGRIAWLQWNHPRMPWDGTELVVDGERVAGGPEEAIVQPAWSPDGRLHWISDRSGWWNLYREGEPLFPAQAEFAMPLWALGQSSYAFLDDGRIACAWSQDAFPHLGLLDPDTGAMEERELELLPTLRSLRIHSDGRRIVYVGASPTRNPAVVVVDADGIEVIASSEAPDRRYVSEPRAISFPSHARTAHALFYPPRNDDYDGPADEKPPLIVLSHGGPTAQAEPTLDLRTQFWTSRGFAVVDVNYGGSSGYGRDYRELLRGEWGVVDLHDCVEAALHLAGEGLVDGERLAIRGGSAGGYTTLCALVFTDVFDVGASYYGVADLAALSADTHKFESSYDLELVPPEKQRERSPIHYVERISAPLIVFQGLDDPIVPPDQAELIVAALRERGLEHEYHPYEGESHGFRRAETIIDSLEAELSFYGRILGFSPA